MKFLTIGLLLITWTLPSYAGDNTTIFSPFTNTFDYVRDPSFIIDSIIVTVPTSPSDTCTTGTMAMESGWHYDCIATDTWERVAIATWTPAVPGAGFLLLEIANGGGNVLLENGQKIQLE